MPGVATALGFTCKVHHEPVGGTFKMSFTNFGSGNGHSFGGEYLELVPGAKICYTDQFDDPNLPGTMKTTIILKPVMCGTEVSTRPAQAPGVHRAGSAQLAMLVEPNIPD
ncbi:MAG: SRPBCC domain-containing protein [Burkholderiales bacterium]|nr:SRPBCC domain-containing protein [Burkholderiales bacterium]